MEETWLDPWSGRLHIRWNKGVRAPRLLSLCSKAWDPQPPNPMHSRAHAPQQEKPQQGEALEEQRESSPHSPQLGRSQAATKTQQCQKLHKQKDLLKNKKETKLNKLKENTSQKIKDIFEKCNLLFSTPASLWGKAVVGRSYHDIWAICSENL